MSDQQPEDDLDEITDESRDTDTDTDETHGTDVTPDAGAPEPTD